MLAFLIQEVIFDKPKKRGRKSQVQKREQEEERQRKWEHMRIQRENIQTVFQELDLTKVQVGVKTIEGFVSAICDLYTYQKEILNANFNPHPRNNQVKKLIEAAKKLNHKLKDDTFQDRLKNTASDIISVSEYMRNAAYIALNDSNRRSQAARISDRLDILMLYSLMARSQITRNLRISEVSVESISQFDPKTFLLRLSLNKSKTNQFERVLSVGVLR